MKLSLPVMAALGLLVPAAAVGQTPPTTAQPGRLTRTAPTSTVLPLSLSDAIARGLQYNLTAILQDEQRQVASGARLEALSALVPHVSGTLRESVQVLNTASFGFTFPGLPTLLGPFSLFDARIAMSAPILDPLAVADLRHERANERAVEADGRNVRETVILAVGNLYLQVVADQARLDAVRSQLGTAEALVQLMTDRNAAGVVARIDVLRQQVQLENARATLIATENDLAKRRLQLARAVGLDAAQAFDLTDRVTFAPAPEMSVDEAVTRATSHRQDLRAAEARLEAARAAHSSAAARHLPSLRVDGDVGLLGPTARTAERTYSVAANVHVPIFDGNEDRAQAIAADAVVRQREAELADVTAGLRFDVSAALLDIKAASAAVDVAKGSEALAREELTQAEDRVRAGIASSIELTQAQESVAHATEQYIASVYNHTIAKASLARALGEVDTQFLALVGGRP